MLELERGQSVHARFKPEGYTVHLLREFTVDYKVDDTTYAVSGVSGIGFIELVPVTGPDSKFYAHMWQFFMM